MACPEFDARFAACASGLASGLALAVRPAGSLEAPRARVGPEDPFCGAVRKDLRVPLRVEGAARTMRGVPARHWDLSGDGAAGGRWSAWFSRTGAAPGDTAGTACGRSPGFAGRGSSARLVGFRPKGVTKAAAPPTASRPALPRPPTAGHSGRSSPPGSPPPLLALHVQAVRPGAPRRALEAVEKVVTTGRSRDVAREHYRYRTPADG